MEKQVLLESAIRMYGGVEPLAEELLNEIGDDPESKVTKFLQRIVDEPEEWEENRSPNRRVNPLPLDMGFMTGNI